MNNEKLESKVLSSCTKLLQEKGYIAVVDVLVEIGVVDNKQLFDWKRQSALF